MRVAHFSYIVTSIITYATFNPNSLINLHLHKRLGGGGFG